MLHVPTLMLALVLGFALLTLELGVSQRGMHARPELKRWTLGCWFFLGGFVMLAARLVLPLGVSVLVGNALICLGMAVYGQALYLMLRQGLAPGWLLGVQPLVWLGLVLMLDWPLHQRTSVLSVVYIVLLAPSVWVIWRSGWRAERSLRTVALSILAGMLAHVVRAVHAWTHPAEYTDLMQASLGQGLTFLLGFMCLISAGFGFVLAVFERVARQMEDMATHDGLTGCLNRSSTDALLAQELVRGRRVGRPVTFVLMDLDHFKAINDEHGHRTGDAVLCAFARTVRARLRATDGFGRTGGEEFGLVLPDTDLAGASRLAGSICSAIEGLTTTSGQGVSVRVTVSAGLAVVEPGQAITADRLYGWADLALYEAKRGGRNRVQAYRPASAAAPDGTGLPAGPGLPAAPGWLDAHGR